MTQTVNLPSVAQYMLETTPVNGSIQRNNRPPSFGTFIGVEERRARDALRSTDYYNSGIFAQRFLNRFISCCIDENVLVWQ